MQPEHEKEVVELDARQKRTLQMIAEGRYNQKRIRELTEKYGFGKLTKILCMAIYTDQLDTNNIYPFPSERLTLKQAVITTALFYGKDGGEIMTKENLTQGDFNCEAKKILEITDATSTLQLVAQMACEKKENGTLGYFIS